MTHLPFIIAAYSLGTVLPLAYAVSAWQRLRLAKRRLAAIDPRARS